MGIVVETIEKFLDALVDEGVMRDVIAPVGKLRRRGKFSMKNQIGRLEVVALFGQLFNRVPAIAQNSLVPVDKRDLAGAGCRVAEGWIVTHHPEIGIVDLDLTQIERSDRVILDRELVSLAGPIVDDGQCVPAGFSGRLAAHERIWFGGIHCWPSQVRARRFERTVYTNTPC